MINCCNMQMLRANRAWAQLVKDKKNEIKAQVNPVFSFWGSTFCVPLPCCFVTASSLAAV